MKTHAKQVAQWTLLVVLVAWGWLSLAFIVSEEMPNVPFEAVIGLKITAFVSLTAAICVGKACGKHGLFREISKQFDEYGK